MNIRLKIVMMGLIIFFALLISWVLSSKAYASDYEYGVCVDNCYLDLPSIEECIVDEKHHWDITNTTDKQMRKDCQSLIDSEKVDCQINCVVAQIKFVDKAEKFYDTDVKNFPLTNED
jgi:hypothetical protein